MSSASSPVLSALEVDGVGMSDREPFLLPVVSSSSSSPVDSSNGTISNSSSRRLGLVARVRRLLLELSRRLPLLCALCSVSSGVTWIVKGFFVCMGMMLMGGVGSFTLHQMMSPQIELLIQQRSTLQKDIDALQIQVENMTRIAESRLETIHLLEQELEKQAVDAAAAAAAAFAAAQSGPDYPGYDGGRGGNGGGFSNGHRVPGMPGGSFTLPTIIYAGLLGIIILVTVVYRVYRIVQAEVRNHKRAVRSSGTSNQSDHPHHHHHHHHRRDLMLPTRLTSPTNSSSMSIGIVNGDDDDRDDLGMALGAESVGDSAAQSPSGIGGGDASSSSSQQQCYKRSQPPLSPASRLMHV